jgi:hypothetical protein
LLLGGFIRTLSDGVPLETKIEIRFNISTRFDDIAEPPELGGECPEIMQCESVAIFSYRI